MKFHGLLLVVGGLEFCVWSVRNSSRVESKSEARRRVKKCRGLLRFARRKVSGLPTELVADSCGPDARPDGVRFDIPGQCGPAGFAANRRRSQQ